MAKKFICIIIVIGCICALLGISFAKYDDIKTNVETIMKNNSIEIWKYKTEIEVLSALLESYFINQEYTMISYYSETILGDVYIKVGDWENNEPIYKTKVPTELTNSPTRIANDIVYKYDFFNRITYNQYENELIFNNSFFATFFNSIQVPIVIIAILATIIIIIITLIVDSIGIVFDAFDLVFSLFGI